jgi:hypothetical protein
VSAGPPPDPWIFAITPEFGSKNFFSTFAQPPTYLIVKS